MGFIWLTGKQSSLFMGFFQFMVYLKLQVQKLRKVCVKSGRKFAILVKPKLLCVCEILHFRGFFQGNGVPYAAPLFPRGHCWSLMLDLDFVCLLLCQWHPTWSVVPVSLSALKLEPPDVKTPALPLGFSKGSCFNFCIYSASQQYQTAAPWVSEGKRNNLDLWGSVLLAPLIIIPSEKVRGVIREVIFVNIKSFSGQSAPKEDNNLLSDSKIRVFFKRRREILHSVNHTE